MSSFWNRMTGGTEESEAPVAPSAAIESTTVTTVGAPHPELGPTYGIAQANDLLSKLATGDNAALVFRIIRTTLESVGVKVSEVIADAERHEGEVRTEIEERRSAIAELERQIEAERAAISALESELALTTRTRSGLERPGASVAPTTSLPSTAPRPSPVWRPPFPSPSRESGANDRPTVVAVATGLPQPVLHDSDIESIPPSAPKLFSKGPKSSETK